MSYLSPDRPGRYPTQMAGRRPPGHNAGHRNSSVRRCWHLWPAITGPTLPPVWAVPHRATAGWRGVNVTSHSLRLLQDLRRSLLEPPRPWGAEMRSDLASIIGGCSGSWSDDAVFLYLLACRLMALLTWRSRSDTAKKPEILVLQHQVAVLRRQVKRVEYRPADRALPALLSRVLPRSAWRSFLVTPETLLRWHRALLTRKWTQPRSPGRPPLPPGTVELIVRLARENPSGATSVCKVSSASSGSPCRRRVSAPCCGQAQDQ